MIYFRINPCIDLIFTFRAVVFPSRLRKENENKIYKMLNRFLYLICNRKKFTKKISWDCKAFFFFLDIRQIDELLEMSYHSRKRLCSPMKTSNLEFIELEYDRFGYIYQM